MLTIAAAFEQFNENVRPAVVATYGETDIVALREAWNDFTDSLTNERDGLNSLQYHYCPAVDDTMPDDDLESDLEFLLDAMNVRMEAKQIDARTDGLMDMPAGSEHYKLTIKRGAVRFTTFYSQGPAVARNPDRVDVLACLFSDASSADEDFGDWCGNFGYDTDSRKAEKTYKGCKKIAAKLAKMFTTTEREDLGEMLSQH